MPEGTYSWILHYQNVFDSTQQKYTLKGSVALLR